MPRHEYADRDRLANEFAGIAPDRLAEMIIAAAKEVAAAWRAKSQAGLEPLERLRLYREERRAASRRDAMQRQLELEFGAAHGWKLSATTFGLVTLALGKRHGGSRSYDEDQGNGYWRGDLHASFDHPYYYRRDGKAAAIVAHLYGWPKVRAGCEATAAHYGLSFEVPDFPSWWNPGGTKLVVYRGPAA
jgi:hypothetical protein